MYRFLALLASFGLIIVRLIYVIYQLVVYTLGFIFGLFSKRIFKFLMQLSRLELTDGNKIKEHKNEVIRETEGLDNSEIFSGLRNYKRE